MVRRKPLVIWVLVLLALLVANSLYLSGETVERTFSKVWSSSLAGVQAVVRTQVLAGEGPLLVTIAQRGIALVGDDGKQRRSYLPPAGVAAGATGDVTGDGLDDIVVASEAGGTLAVTLLDGALKPLWSAALDESAAPQRVLIVELDGDGQRDVVVACAGGRLHALSSRGKLLWHWVMEPEAAGEEAEVRGLDDVKVGRLRRVAVGRRDGQLALLDGRGQPVWSQSLPSKVRRLRALEIGAAHDSVLLVGSEDGVCRQLQEQVVPGQASHFRLDVREQVGEPITEIRSVDVDGNHETRELVLGGKNGRVVIVGAGSGKVAGKVSAITGVDLDGDGRDEVVVGTEAGYVETLNAGGAQLGGWTADGKVDALVGVPGNAGSRFVVVAAGASLSAYRYGERVPPSWYRPGSAAALGVFALGGVTFVLLRLKAPAPAPPTPRPDGSLVRRRKIEASLQAVAGLQEQGVVKPADAQERIDQLQAQLAALDRAPAAPMVAPPPPPPPKR